MAARKKHTPEQVVRKGATADRMLNEGKDVAEVCRELQVSEQTYYRWRNQFGGMNVWPEHLHVRSGPRADRPGAPARETRHGARCRAAGEIKDGPESIDRLPSTSQPRWAVVCGAFFGTRLSSSALL
jgi:transposase-like protein